MKINKGWFYYYLNHTRNLSPKWHNIEASTSKKKQKEPCREVLIWETWIYQAQKPYCNIIKLVFQHYKSTRSETMYNFT